MRAILFILIIAVVALLIAVATGFLDINQTRPAKVPEVSVDDGRVSARGGQPPSFDIETGSVAVGRKNTNVTVPSVTVNPPEETANNSSTNAN